MTSTSRGRRCRSRSRSRMKSISVGATCSPSERHRSVSGFRPSSSGWTRSRSIRHAFAPPEAHDADGDGRNRPRDAAQPDRTGDRLDRAAHRLLIGYVDNRGTGSFILIDPVTHFTAGAGMIAEAASASARPQWPGRARPSVWRAWRVKAPGDAEAVEAVRKALEELLT